MKSPSARSTSMACSNLFSLPALATVAIAGILPSHASAQCELVAASDASVVRTSYPDGQSLGSMVDSNLSFGVRMEFLPDGDLLVMDLERGIERFRGTDGQFETILIDKTTTPDLFGMTLGPDGNLYVSYGTGRLGEEHISRFNATTGAFIDDFVSTGSVDAGTDLLFGPDGHFYVARFNTTNSFASVLRFDGTSGAFIDTFVPEGTGGLVSIGDMQFLANGDLIVSDWDSDTIRRYDGTSGASLGDFVLPGVILRPYGMTMGPDGDLYVVSAQTFEIVHIDGSTGALEEAFVTDGARTDIRFRPESHCLTTSDPVPGRAGRSNTFTVTNATPLAPIDFYYSFTTGSTPVATCSPGVVLTLNAPVFVATRNADANGTAVLTKTVPSAARNALVRIQTVEKSSCRVSNRVDYRFR